MTKERLLEEYKYLVYKISSYFYNAPKEDLIQAGYIGLLNAYDNYKKEANVKFSTYAFKSIYGAMYKVAIKNNPIKVSRDILLLCKKIEKARSIIAQKINRIPSNKEIAVFLEMDEKEIEMALVSAYEIVSLDNDCDNKRNYYETIADKENISLDDRIDIYDSMKHLNKDEQDIINARYFKDMTQQEVARKLKMTQVMVSRYEKKAVEKMRNYMTA